MAVTYEWRGPFDNVELNKLHAEAFETRVFDETEWNWVDQVRRHSLGWVVARDGNQLIGFVNVLWDGLVHAWLQDTMVAKQARHHGVGTALVALAVDQARQAGCEWLHRLRGAPTFLLLRRLRVQTDRRRAHRLVARAMAAYRAAGTSLPAAPVLGNVT
jgi:GNAT superfamily N-acetyltransferase